MRSAPRTINRILKGLGVLAVVSSHGADPTTVQSAPRVWRNNKGATLEAVWRGVEANNAIFTLKDGKTTQVPVASLCKEDQQFMAARIASLVATAMGDDTTPTFSSLGAAVVTGEWPKRIKIAAAKLETRTVSEDIAASICIYESAHFRYTCHTQLAPEVLADMAGNFEAVHEWMRLSPWGLLSGPHAPKYEVVVFEHREEISKIKPYPPGLGTYYSSQKRRLYTCLEETGLKPVGKTWMMDASFQPAMLLNQLTELLLHEIRSVAPPWLMVGLPLYMEHMPLRGGTLWTKQASTAAAEDLTLGNKVVSEERLGSMLTITIDSWNKDVEYQPARIDASGKNMGPPASSNGSDKLIPIKSIPLPSSVPTGRAEEKGPSYNEIKSHTAFFIADYYLNLADGGKAETLAKFIKALAGEAAAWRKFTDDAAAYKAQIEEFVQKPGVQRMADGTIRYPISLTPPKVPSPPHEGSSDDWTVSHLKLLLGDRSAAETTAQIRSALVGAGLLTEP